MRRRVVLLGICLLLAGGASTGAATIGFQARTETISASTARERCPGQVVAANRYWMVTYKFESVYTYLDACDRRKPRRVLLNISSADVAGPAVALRGQLIAHSETFYDDTTFGPQVNVINPNNPRETYQLLGAPAYGNVSDIVLQDRSRVAWISCRLKLPHVRDENDPECPGGTVKRIYVVDRSSPPLEQASRGWVADEARLLATGRNIRSRSLNIDAARRIVSWREGDRMMRYRLR